MDNSFFDSCGINYSQGMIVDDIERLFLIDVSEAALFVLLKFKK